MTTFTLFLVPEARKDIQNGIKYYNSKVNGLGQKFYEEVKASFDLLVLNPFFQIRYEEVRCLPLRKFPYMIHYKLNEEKSTIIVYAVIHTSKDPNKHWIEHK